MNSHRLVWKLAYIWRLCSQHNWGGVGSKTEENKENDRAERKEQAIELAVKQSKWFALPAIPSFKFLIALEWFVYSRFGFVQ